MIPIYLRITVDGIPKETSTKLKWDISCWDQNQREQLARKKRPNLLTFSCISDLKCTI
ncbi:Arm DNA-binding domain-containing protein [Flavobacterium sp. 7E]|uniref:Arm DNA-binding domain-containing protein n=1 Tax=Flavobacterium sp. 7E TaxID=2735898 RepID=UPI0020C6D7F8|nr:Arm DNA-binding domain-containing protein [Flavobacterium sp. 7E]